LHDAQPTRAEREREPDARKRYERAVNQLAEWYWNAKKRKQIAQLDPRFLLVCELLKDRNELPSTRQQKGGRPKQEHNNVLIAVHVKEAIKNHGGKHGSKEKAFRDVVKSDGVSYDHVKDIYYRAFGEHFDPDFRQAVELALCDRRLPLSDRKEG
jgi:hypothetical protein